MGYNKLIDYLSIINFFVYYLFGIIVKRKYLLALLLGIVWEILEYIITKNSITRHLLIKYWPVPKQIWDEDAFNINRVSDIIFNMLGYHFGNKRLFKYIFI